MESLQSLKDRKRQLEYELEVITIKKHSSVKWNPGIQDQYNSESYTYNNYTNPSKAYKLIDQIKELNFQIENYAQMAQKERKLEEEKRNTSIKKFQYVDAKGMHETTNPAIAARYNAQHRFFGMNKFRQTLSKMSGQKRKFEKLWNKAGTLDEQQQHQIAKELNSLFR